MNDERIKTAYAEGSRAGVSRGKSIVESQINVLREESEEWRGKFNAFARAIGFEDTDELRYVSPQEVATAIKLYTNNGIKYQVQSLRQIHERIGEILDGAEKILPIKSQEVRP